MAMRSLFEEAKDNLSQLPLAEVARRASTCQLCRLKESRTRVVFGQGPVPCDLLFLGEGPGEVEDQQGLAFVGPAGQLLTAILASAGMQRDEVYISNMVKCRPPLNRTPQRDEIETCWPYLEAQIKHIMPKIVVCLGNVPAQWLLKTQDGITQLRGQFHPWRAGIEIFPMFHPSYLLRNPSKEKGSPKYITWQDIQKLKQRWDGLRHAV